MSKHQASSAASFHNSTNNRQNGSKEGSTDVGKSAWTLPDAMNSQGNLSQEIADAFANMEVQKSLSFTHPGSPHQQTAILHEQGLLNGVPGLTDRVGADLDHELSRDETLYQDFTSQNAPSSEGPAPLQFTDKLQRKEGTPESHGNRLTSPPRQHLHQNQQQQPIMTAEKALGRGSSTPSGFNAIGSQPRKHNQWHGGGRLHNIAGAGRGLNSQLKAGTGGGIGNKVYQNRTTVNSSVVGGTKKGPGNNPNSGSVQQRNAAGNVRRKAKNIVVPPLEDTSSSSLQAEPSGWGDLPSPKPVNVDTGTSAWGAPPSDLGKFPKDIHSGAGWGEKGSWRSQQGGRDEGDSTGTQAAGWHGTRTGWGSGKMAADAQVAKLMEMGFDREDVVKALDTNNLNFDSALGDLLASNVEDCVMPTEPSTSTQTAMTNSTFATAANSLVPHHATASSNGRKQPQTTFFPNRTQPPAPVLQGLPSTNNVGTQAAWPTALATQPGVLALRNPVGLPQTQLPAPNNAKIRNQLIQQQQLNQQMALLQLQLSRMPAPVANIRLQIAHFQVLSQQLAQQQQQLKGMVPTQQIIGQQQQLTQQLFQVSQIIQHLQQQLMVALKQHPSAMKGVALAPGVNPTLAQQAAVQGLLAAGQQQVGGVNSATPLKLGSGPLVSAARTVPLQQPSLLPTQLSLPQKDSRASIGAVAESTTATAAAKMQPNRSLSAPSAPTVPESNSKRTLPKIDARFFPDTIPEFQPGKPWQPRPKPTEPAQVYGNGTSTAPALDGTTKTSTSIAAVSSVVQPKKLSAEARPFTLQKWSTAAFTDETEVHKMSESSSPSASSEASPASQAPATTKRPQQLTFTDDDILGPSVPSYGLSTTPLTSMWSMSSRQRMSGQITDASQTQSSQASNAMSPLPLSLPSMEDANPLLSPPPSDKLHLKDVPNIGLWNHEGLARGKIHSPELSFTDWQAGKKAHLTVFKLPTNPPSAWLLVKGLPVGVEQDEVKATCSEYGEPRSFFFNKAESSALIQYQNKEQAMHAKTGLDKTLLNGLCVSTDFASDVDIERFFDSCSGRNSPSSVPTFGPLEGVEPTGVVSPSALLYPEDSVSSHTPGHTPVSPITQVANGNNPPTELPVGLTSEEGQPSKWDGPPIDIPKSQVSQLWSTGDYNSLIGYNTATPTTPDAEEWNHISSSPSLTKFLPGGLF